MHIQHLTYFGGFVFYYINPMDIELANYFFFVAQNRHQFSFFYKSINDKKAEGK